MRAGAAIVVAALVAAVAPLPSGLVERWYSLGLYARFQPGVTAFSNHAPFALFDLLLATVPLAWLLLTARDVAARPAGGRLRGVGRAVARLAVWAAVLYLAFLGLWGLNYRRVPLTTKLAYDAGAVTPDAARALAGKTVGALNALHDSAHRGGWVPAGAIDMRLAGAFADAVREVGGPGDVVVGRPKLSVLDWYFRRAGVSGMTDPYFLETMVSSDLLPFERPFVLGHEWAHLAGFANEGEASFIGWLSCMQSGVPEQYSGWLSLYEEVAASLPAADRTEVAARLADGPRGDLRAVQARLLREVSPRVSAAGWRVYDRYLKANRVEAGTASYGEVVQLVLGTPLARRRW
jgi:hypothetical protein